MNTGPRLLIAPLLVAAVASGQNAFAQTSCPTPVVAQCRTPEYLATDCGKASVASDTSSCSVLLRESYRLQVQRPDVSVEEVVSADDPDSTLAASTKRYDFATHTVQDFNARFLRT